MNARLTLIALSLTISVTSFAAGSDRDFRAGANTPSEGLLTTGETETTLAATGETAGRTISSEEATTESTQTPENNRQIRGMLDRF